GKGKTLTRTRRQFYRTGKGGGMEVTPGFTPQPGTHAQRPQHSPTSVVYLDGNHIPFPQTQRPLEPQARLQSDLGSRVARNISKEQGENTPGDQPVHAPSEADDTRRTYLAMTPCV